MSVTVRKSRLIATQPTGEYRRTSAPLAPALLLSGKSSIQPIGNTFLDPCSPLISQIRQRGFCLCPQLTGWGTMGTELGLSNDTFYLSQTSGAYTGPRFRDGGMYLHDTAGGTNSDRLRSSLLYQTARKADSTLITGVTTVFVYVPFGLQLSNLTTSGDTTIGLGHGVEIATTYMSAGFDAGNGAAYYKRFYTGFEAYREHCLVISSECKSASPAAARLTVAVNGQITPYATSGADFYISAASGGFLDTTTNYAEIAHYSWPNYYHFKGILKLWLTTYRLTSEAEAQAISADPWRLLFRRHNPRIYVGV